MPATLSLRTVGVLAAAFTTILLPAHARADEFTDRANRTYASIPADRRSDTVLLPLLAKAEAPPRAVATRDAAALLPATAADFKAASDWAQAAPQTAVLKALADITKETDWRKSYAFGQPYGADYVAPEFIASRMYTDLGDPPTLAAAQHLYLPALDRLTCLVNVEATRLAADGKPGEAIDALTNLAYFSRQMCDRAFYEEAAWGLKNLAHTYERIRDIGYVDMRGTGLPPGPRQIDTNRLLEQMKRLAEEGAYLDLSRMLFPAGDRIAVEQVVARVYIPRAGVNEQVFASTMARLGSTDHPLRLFSESGRWASEASRQANWFEATQKTAAVFDDWNRRWLASWFDRSQALVSEWTKLDAARFAAVTQGTPEAVALRDMRQIALVESVGTRAALAVLGTYYVNKSFPVQLSAVRPRWMNVLEIDPFNPTVQSAGSRPPLEYFVPMRDTPLDDRGQPMPYPMEVVTTDPQRPLSLNMTADTFVLYSRGSDNSKDLAKKNQNTAQVVQNADYLIWPPVISLHRQRLLDLDQLK